MGDSSGTVLPEVPPPSALRTQYNVFGISAVPSQESNDKTVVAVGVFFGLFTLVIACLAVWGYRYLRRRGLTAESHANAPLESCVVDEAQVPTKPVLIPIIVVLPNNDVAFGWKEAHDVDSPDDDIIDDSLKDQKL